MQVIDLFSGIGGFSLAARWAGWETIQLCEIDKFCQKVLSHHFPNVPIHDDIKTMDYEKIISRIERSDPTIIVGGFPCQPFSTAGKQKGTEDERHLWPEMLRAIREIKPTWVVGENVRGLVSWSGGLAFDQVQADLEAAGYEVQPFILPACGKNAPHQRDRVWIVANSCNERLQRGKLNGTFDQEAKEQRKQPSGSTTERHKITDWQQWPTQPPICSRDDGIPGGLVNITFPKWRKESLKALGNAIVPQVAYQIFQAINEYEQLNRTI